MYERRRLTAQQKEDNGDKKRLVCQHWNDLLRLLICERDRQRTALRRLDSASSFAISNFLLRVRYMMRMRIQPAVNICIGISTANMIANIVVYLQYRQIVV